MLVLTSEQMRKVEQNAVDLGMSWLRLMENTGSAAAKEIRKQYDLKNKKIVIVCGKGNNGGDGYVIARKLNENDIQSRVISVGTPSTDSSKEMYSKLLGLGIRPLDFETYKTLCCQYINDADYIIDAVFGTGFKGSPNGIFGLAIAAMQKSNAIKIAIDIPSGINSDNCYCEVFIKADLTVTFANFKPCHLLYPSNEFCGKVIVSSIGIPDESYKGVDTFMTTVSDRIAASLLPKRQLNCHKGDCGTAGLYVGNKVYSGAAIIAVKGAVLSGAGIVNAIIPESIYNIVGTATPEAVYTVLDGDSLGGINYNDSNKVISALNKCNAGLVGCGLLQNDYSIYNLKQIMSRCNVPLVIDADGINILSNCIDLIKDYPNEVIITPHPKEASRLLKCTVEDVQKNRIDSAKKLVELTDATVVLKGAGTIIATPDKKLYIVTDGNPGMATAGTGDMLAGMIVAFLSQGLSALDASLLATKLHAVSGDLSLKTSSLLSLTPSEMLNNLPRVISDYYKI